MKTLKIYDPAMCCSSGVCGPDVDQDLVQLAGFLKGIEKSGITVERYNLSQQPAAYASNPAVAVALKERGVKVLPLVYLEDEEIFSGGYPAVEEFAKLLGVETPSSVESSCCSGGDCC